MDQRGKAVQERRKLKDEGWEMGDGRNRHLADVLQLG
jgi:hypothetical protein